MHEHCRPDVFPNLEFTWLKEPATHSKILAKLGSGLLFTLFHEIKEAQNYLHAPYLLNCNVNIQEVKNVTS